MLMLKIGPPVNFGVYVGKGGLRQGGDEIRRGSDCLQRRIPLQQERVASVTAGARSAKATCFSLAAEA